MIDIIVPVRYGVAFVVNVVWIVSLWQCAMAWEGIVATTLIYMYTLVLYIPDTVCMSQRRKSVKNM